MRFVKVYFSTFVLFSLFFVCGGWMLLSFSHEFLSLAAYSFIIAIVVYIFIRQDERIEALEKKLLESEDNKDR